MKWSLLISWLNQKGSEKNLRFVQQIPVDHSAWFPEWASRASELRFRDWDKVRFFERGHLGTETEAMPILASYYHKSFADEKQAHWVLSGGVSLGSKGLFETRASLSRELPSVMRRSGLDYKTVSGSNELVTLRGTRYKFTTPKSTLDAASRGVGRDMARIDISAKEGLKYRARFGEMDRGRFERVVETTGNNLRIEERAAAGEIGHLNVSRSRNGFRVGWRSREIDDGYTVARRLSASEDFAAQLKNDDLVEAALADQEGGAYYVKTYGGRKWMKIAPEGKPLPDLGSGWNARVADLSPEARPVNIAWLEEGEIPVATRESGNWVRGPPGNRSNIERSAEDFLGDSIEKRADAIVRDPVAYKTKVEARLKARVTEIDNLLEQGQTKKALAKIEESFGEFGNHEQLHLRQALAELAEDRPSAAADAINGTRLPTREQANTIIEEVNGRLAKYDNQAYRRIAENADWRTTAVKPPKDEVMLTVTSDGTLDHEVRLSTPVQGQGG